MKFSVCLFFLAAVAVCPASTGTFPEPAIIQPLGQWTMNTVFDQPRQITVRLTGEQNPRRFWYVILTLTNESTTRDVPFFPFCQLMTDTFQIVTAKDARKEVFDQIKIRHQSAYPFLERLDYVDTKILQGVDNAVDVVIIWPDFDPQAKEVTLFISGLSNETRAIDHPLKKDQDGRPEKVLLRKTLALKYGIGGDPGFRQAASLQFIDKNWVMR